MAVTSQKKLYYFTASFPFGLGETWKTNELSYFVGYFDEIIVVPYSYGGNFSSPKKLPPGVKLEGPLFESNDVVLNKYSLLHLLDRYFFYYISELFRKKVIFSKAKIISWLRASLHIKRLLKHPVIRKIMSDPGKDVVLYFFWGKGACDFLPFADKSKFGNTAVRFHRYDLFEDQNGGYIPYRSQLLQSLDIAVPSSEVGAEHMRSLYPGLRIKFLVNRLGVVGEGRTSGSSDNTLRIVSCSYLVPVKRVHLLAEALAYLSIPVEWTHVGDGPLMSEIRSVTEHLPGNIKVNFPGMINSNEIMNFYKARPIDLFVNVSSSEGVPFSIMEALSAGMPVFATGVGGTGEIIDDNVGKLLSADIKPEELAFFLEAFYNKTTEEKMAIRNAAFHRYEDKCDASVLSREFADILIR